MTVENLWQDCGFQDFGNEVFGGLMDREGTLEVWTPNGGYARFSNWRDFVSMMEPNTKVSGQSAETVLNRVFSRANSTSKAA